MPLFQPHILATPFPCCYPSPSLSRASLAPAGTTPTLSPDPSQTQPTRPVCTAPLLPPRPCYQSKTGLRSRRALQLPNCDRRRWGGFMQALCLGTRRASGSARWGCILSLGDRHCDRDSRRFWRSARRGGQLGRQSRTGYCCARRRPPRLGTGLARAERRPGTYAGLVVGRTDEHRDGGCGRLDGSANTRVSSMVGE
ncbi:hypothetical protein VTI28DRAFT_647 [Corynascus sepedonium]